MALFFWREASFNGAIVAQLQPQVMQISQLVAQLEKQDSSLEKQGQALQNAALRLAEFGRTSPELRADSGQVRHRGAAGRSGRRARQPRPRAIIIFTRARYRHFSPRETGCFFWAFCSNDVAREPVPISALGKIVPGAPLKASNKSTASPPTCYCGIRCIRRRLFHIQINQDVARFGALARADDAAVLEFIHDARGAGIAEPQAGVA
jgi:hypothetical protein